MSTEGSHGAVGCSCYRLLDGVAATTGREIERRLYHSPISTITDSNIEDLYSKPYPGSMVFLPMHLNSAVTNNALSGRCSAIPRLNLGSREAHTANMHVFAAIGSRHVSNVSSFGTKPHVELVLELIPTSRKCYIKDRCAGTKVWVARYRVRNSAESESDGLGVCGMDEQCATKQDSMKRNRCLTVTQRQCRWRSPRVWSQNFARSPYTELA